MSFGGITSVLSGSYTMTQGVLPSVAQLQIAPQARVPVQGDLTITYGSTRIVLPGFVVNQQTLQYDSSGFVTALSLYDRRLRWRHSYVRGSYNLRFPDGSLNTTTEMALAEMMAFCLDAMGERRYDVGAAPGRLRPEVHWDYDNAAQALEALCQLCSCRVVLGLDNRVRVIPEGTGAALPAGNLMAASKSAIPPFIPDELLFVAGPSRYEIDVMVSPVGLDLDGSTKPIDDLSYAPAGGWGTNKYAAPMFSGLDSGKFSGTRAREYAAQSVFRWWQIDPAPRGIDGKPLKIPGYDGPPIRSRKQILPLESDRVEVWTDVFEIVINKDGEPEKKPVPKNRPAFLWGFYPINLANGKDNINLPLTAVAPGHLVPPSDSPPPFKNGSGAEFTRGFSIDQAEGIIKVNESCCYTKRFPAGTLKQLPAIFALRIACSIRDQIGKLPVRYTQSLRLGRAGNGTRVIKHEECQAGYWPSRGLKDNVFAVNSTVDKSVLPNVPPLKDEAKYYLEAAKREYQVNSPEEGLYAGLLPISPDGALAVVHWEFGSGGATTRVSRNGELAEVLVPYRERQMLVDLWGIRDQMARIDADKRRLDKVFARAKQNG